jgi:hypothetical protein
MTTRDRQLQEAIEHLQARVLAAGGSLASYLEGTDCYRLVASLPQYGERETLWLQWDADRQEPRFLFGGRDYSKRNGNHEP